VALPALGNGTFFGVLRQHHVLLASPHPPAECGQRLADNTGSRFSGGLHRTPLRGQVSPGLIRVALRATRRLLPIWLSGQIRQGPRGGTVIHATVGTDPSIPVVFAWASLVALMVPVAMFATGLATLASGDLAGVLLQLASIMLAGIWVLGLTTGIRLARSDSQELLDQLNAILDSTATPL
jgi:hypothetical protein